ncbi:thiol peroxidase [Ruminococcaceae bacterium OttesenSCG-928-A16]|nr:thiol peroxidase [Ruminococcaceae bacterium OttesenSCG-928-A16]
MAITFGGSPVTLKGNALKQGDKIPAFSLVDNDLKEVKSEDLTGLRAFVVVPSLDTSVCDLEVRNFNAKAASLPGVHIYAVSMDLPFAQARWCGANGIEAVKTLSDYHHRSFGEATGTYIDELGLLTRAIFIVDNDNTVAYAEYVPEVTDHPNYDAVYAKLQELSK